MSNHRTIMTSTDVVDTTKLYPPLSSNRLEKIYVQTATNLYKKYVHVSAEPEKQEGKMIKYYIQIYNELTENRKLNWNSKFVTKVWFIRNTLIKSVIFPDEIKDEIRSDTDFILNYQRGDRMDKNVLIRITRRIDEWYWASL